MQNKVWVPLGVLVLLVVALLYRWQPLEIEIPNASKILDRWTGSTYFNGDPIIPSSKLPPKPYPPSDSSILKKAYYGKQLTEYNEAVAAEKSAALAKKTLLSILWTVAVIITVVWTLYEIEIIKSNPWKSLKEALRQSFLPRNEG